jgi:hypothetical protein
VLALLLVSPTQALRPNTTIDPCGAQQVTAKGFKQFAAKTWRLPAWNASYRPPHRVLTGYQVKLACAAGPGHRKAMRATWERRKRRYRRLATSNINHRWAPHWAPDYSGPKLPPYVIAALAEQAGDALGVDVPGWTMAQMTIGESGGRPGSAGVDIGGTVGYGMWAITSPFANAILAKHGWSYEDMWNPVRNSMAMAEIYASQGLGAWYGDGFVTDRDAHYRGKLDLSRVLGGLSYRRALRASR